MSTKLNLETDCDQVDPDLIQRVSSTTSRVRCVGLEGALGHPQVWLTIGKEGRVTCPYCSREFIRVKV